LVTKLKHFHLNIRPVGSPGFLVRLYDTDRASKYVIPWPIVLPAPPLINATIIYNYWELYRVNETSGEEEQIGGRSYTLKFKISPGVFELGLYRLYVKIGYPQTYYHWMEESMYLRDNCCHCALVLSEGVDIHLSGRVDYHGGFFFQKLLLENC
jgi:hypothetical protein